MSHVHLVGVDIFLHRVRGKHTAQAAIGGIFLQVAVRKVGLSMGSEQSNMRMPGWSGLHHLRRAGFITAFSVQHV
jgi:hypothetical protein